MNEASLEKFLLISRILVAATAVVCVGAVAWATITVDNMTKDNAKFAEKMKRNRERPMF